MSLSTLFPGISREKTICSRNFPWYITNSKFFEVTITNIPKRLLQFLKAAKLLILKGVAMNANKSFPYIKHQKLLSDENDAQSDLPGKRSTAKQARVCFVSGLESQRKMVK